MSAANGITWDIYEQPHGNHVTCQRPIVLSARTSQGQPAHFRGTLWIESPAHSNTYVNTEVQFNAYSNAGDGIFQCNVAEYCRQYFVDEPKWFGASWCGVQHDRMFNRRFKVLFNPVIVQSNGTLYSDYDDSKETETFNVFPLNTKPFENHSTDSGIADYQRIDFFVHPNANGSGLAAPQPGYYRPLTNMPQRNAINFDKALAWQTYSTIVDMPNNKQLQTTITSPNGSYDLVWNPPPPGHWMLHVHPWVLEFYITLSAGGYQNILLNQWGIPVADEFSVSYTYLNSNGTTWKDGPTQKYTIIRDTNCGGRADTTFIFRNQRGAMDFFTARGKRDKQVTIGGTTFKKHNNYNRSSRTPAFGTLVGQHSETNLWGDREDSFTVFSQALTDEQCFWLEELIVSPEVWVCENVDKTMRRTATTDALVAIVIDKASYQVFSTEKNVNYMEFKYHYSEPTLTKKM